MVFCGEVGGCGAQRLSCDYLSLFTGDVGFMCLKVRSDTNEEKYWRRIMIIIQSREVRKNTQCPLTHKYDAMLIPQRQPNQPPKTHYFR
jgi:hypothetical protein